MRSIKFRAWDKKNDEWLPVSFISWELDGGLIGVNSKAWHEVELMQHTGLKDKNGKEIYEGDIVRFSDGVVLPVYYRDAWACFCVDRKDVGAVRVLEVKDYKYNTPVEEVLGNIYENKELLDG